MARLYTAEETATSHAGREAEEGPAVAPRRPRAAVAYAAALALTAVAAVGRAAGFGPGTLLRAAVLRASPSHPHAWRSNYTVVVSNEYSRLYGQPGRGYPFLTEGSVVEPHAETLLRVLWTGGAAPSAGVSELRWEIEQFTNFAAFGKQVETHVAAVGSGGLAGAAASDGSSSSSSSSSGECLVVFKNVGTYRVRVALVDGLRETATVERTFYSRYVRRSIRKLTAMDRDTYLDAFKLMLAMSRAEGEHRYGKNYRSVDYFVGVHLERAGARTVDKMHDGMGFLTQHIALTNEFELSLQTISPKLSVPYWDYTSDGERVRSLPGGALPDLWDDALWRDDWFGNATGSPKHAVTGGRFAYQRITNVGRESAITHNAYGYMRAPWNVNKSPYLTRVHNFCGATFDVRDWPGCETHWNLTFRQDSFYDYVWAAPYAPHGPVHFMIGGYTNCGNLTARLGGVIPRLAYDSLALKMLDVPKNMWREFMTEFPTHCSEDTPQEDCHMVCADSSGALDNPNYVSGLYTTWFGDWIADLSAAHYDAFMGVLCSTPWTPGEQIEAASPADVSFWPVHPTLDRLLQYKRIVQPFVEPGWADPVAGPMGTLYCSNPMTSDCMGHHAEDVTPFLTSAEGDDGEFTSSYLTNAEILNISSPGHYKMHYIYDAFEWDHCDATDFRFKPTRW